MVSSVATHFYDVLSAAAQIHRPFVQRNLKCSPGQLSPPGKSQCSIVRRSVMLDPQQSHGALASVFLHTARESLPFSQRGR